MTLEISATGHVELWWYVRWWLAGHQKDDRPGRPAKPPATSSKNFSGNGLPNTHQKFGGSEIFEGSKVGQRTNHQTIFLGGLKLHLKTCRLQDSPISLVSIHNLVSKNGNFGSKFVHFFGHLILDGVTYSIQNQSLKIGHYGWCAIQ